MSNYTLKRIITSLGENLSVHEITIKKKIIHENYYKLILYFITVYSYCFTICE